MSWFVEVKLTQYKLCKDGLGGCDGAKLIQSVFGLRWA